MYDLIEDFILYLVYFRLTFLSLTIWQQKLSKKQTNMFDCSLTITLTMTKTVANNSRPN